MTITDSDLQAWQQACDAATPEPWELWDNRGIQCREPVHWTFGPGGWRPDKWRDVGDPLSGYSNQGVNINGLNGVRAPEDCAFIATARTAMPRLIAEVRRLNGLQTNSEVLHWMLEDTCLVRTGNVWREVRSVEEAEQLIKESML